MIQAYNNTPRKCLDYRTPTEIFLDRALHVKCESTDLQIVEPCQRFKSTPKAVAGISGFAPRPIVMSASTGSWNAGGKSITLTNANK